MNEVSEKGLQVIFGDFFSLVIFAGGYINGSLAQKSLSIGRHVAQVVHHHEHLHHRLVRVEERLKEDVYSESQKMEELHDDTMISPRG